MSQRNTKRSRSISRRRSALARSEKTFDRLESRLLMASAGDVLSYHDGSLTGANISEVQLTPVDVQTGSFGRLFTTTVDGQVYAEPLVESGVTIAEGPNTKTGAAGVHNVVYVATEHDSLYALDTANGAVLWQRNFLDTAVASNNTMNATAITTVPNGDTGSGDITPEIGITGTPVIDAATNTLYVVAKTKETINGAAHDVQRLHAINIGDGTDRVSPFLIGDTTNGNSNNTQLYVYGIGDGFVIDPYNNTGNRVVQFNALREAQRQALSLVNGKVYVSWASHGDNGPYHGLVAAWDVSNLSTAGFTLAGVLNTSPNGGLAGVWGGGGQLAFDSDGSTFYFETGNGPPGHGNPTLNAASFPADGNYDEALLKVVPDATTSPTNQNINGWGFKVADYFIPFNQVALDNADEDFGSSSPMILPDSAGIAGHPHLLIASGKEGKIYLVDRDNLGKFNPTNDNVLNAVPNTSGNNTPPVQISGTLSTAAYFHGTIYETSGYSGTSNAYAINPNGTLTQTSQSSENSFGYLPGSVSVSGNGTSNGVVWVMDRNTNEIHAYNATSMAIELWNSGQAASDALGAVVKFAVPTVSQGRVFVGTTNSLVVYGLTKATSQAPAAPVLTAFALSRTSVNLSWTDPSLAPDVATGYLIEESTDGTNYTRITTAAAGTTALAVGGLTSGTMYFFRILGQNSAGTSAASNVVTVTTSDQVAVLNFSNGFSGATSNLALNGPVTLNGSKLELTNGQNYEDSSAFSLAPVDVTRFSTQFSFQLTNPVADGFTFTIQGNGPRALGGQGGAIGYGSDGTAAGIAIGKSVAVKFDLWNNSGEGTDSTGLYTNGATPTDAGSVDLTNTGIDLHSSHVFLVNMTYDGTTLSVTITDGTTNTSATENYAVNIPGTVGGTLAYVGFTGATGGSAATQDILSWTYSSNTSTAQAPNAPSALGAVPASATSINLSWTDNSSNQSGSTLDRATDAGFTQNVVTQTLPVSPSSVTDSATGLAPGSTFYYRLRAFNASGASANSNVVQVTIPLAPPKPSNLQVTGVTTSEVDLSWVDNASTKAHAYLILRSVAGAAFTQYATLPATSDVPGKTYAWSDKNVTPGTTYDYHVEDVNSSGNNDFVGTNLVTITAPPTGLVASPSGGSINLSWTAVSGALQYNVYRGTSPGGESATPIATVTSGTRYADAGVTAGTTYNYIVTSVNANINRRPALPAESLVSNEATTATATAIRPQPVPSPWTSQDVGAPALAGPASYSGGVFTVKGTGSDIWNNADQFQFVDQPLNGDGTIVARVTGQSNTDPWAKSGLMVRVSSAAGAAYVDLFQTPGNGVNFQYRTSTGASASGSNSGPAIAGPLWLKLTRVGNTFTGSASTDGANYTQIGTISVLMPGTVLAGLEVTSHNAASLSLATFDNVSVTPAAVATSALPSPWLSGDVGSPSLAGSAGYAGGRFTVAGSGAGVRQASDQFRYVDQMTTGNTTVSARVVSQTGTNGWAKSGVMIRATSDPASAYAGIFLTVGNGLTFEYRTASGAIAQYTENGPAMNGPVFLRIVRSGSTFTGSYSIDGVTYRQLGAAVVTMANNTFTGLGVTSHDTAGLNTATIDKVSVTSP